MQVLVRKRQVCAQTFTPELQIFTQHLRLSSHVQAAGQQKKPAAAAAAAALRLTHTHLTPHLTHHFDCELLAWIGDDDESPHPPSLAPPPPPTAASISLYRLPPTCAHTSPPPQAPPPPQQQAPIVVEELPATSSYIMENGIPPGSILVNPHTGG